MRGTTFKVIVSVLDTRKCVKGDEQALCTLRLGKPCLLLVGALAFLYKKEAAIVRVWLLLIDVICLGRFTPVLVVQRQVYLCLNRSACLEATKFGQLDINGADDSLVPKVVDIVIIWVDHAQFGTSHLLVVLLYWTTAVILNHFYF